jgi:hypothetical protein
MNRLTFIKILLFSMIFSFSATLCEAQSFDKPVTKLTRNVSKKSVKQKKDRYYGPKSVKRTQKKQAANDRKLKKDYEDFVKSNQQRSIEIQTPEVKERMKQNFRNADASYKAKKKHNSGRTKNAGKKYR